MNSIADSTVVSYLDTHLKFYGIRPLAKELHVTVEELAPVLKHLNEEHKICRSGRMEYTSYCSLILSKRNAALAVERLRQLRPPREPKAEVVEVKVDKNKVTTQPYKIPEGRIGVYESAQRKRKVSACFSQTDDFFKALLNEPAEAIPSGHRPGTYKGFDKSVTERLEEFHYTSVPVNTTLDNLDY